MFLNHTNNYVMSLKPVKFREVLVEGDTTGEEIDFIFLPKLTLLESNVNIQT